MRPTITRLEVSLGIIAGVIAIGTIGFWGFGFTPLDAFFQTITTVTTVGYSEVQPFGTSEKLWASFVILTGVGAVLYALTVIMQMVVEGQLRDVVGRRRMERTIDKMRNHAIVCGWGRVGRAVACDLAAAGTDVVVVDVDADRIRDIPFPSIVGDATLDTTLRQAGIERAVALVAALEGDAENLFVTLSCRAIRPDLFIVARAREDESVPKLSNAGADRVVNPQELGAARMASFIARPNVAEFVDVVMHERSLEFQMREFTVEKHSSLAGRTLRDANIRERSGALILALRDTNGSFTTNPTGDTVIHPGHVIIAVGTEHDFKMLLELVT